MTYFGKLLCLFVVFKVNSRTIFKVPDCHRGRGCPCISIPAVRHALLCPFKTFIICLPALVNTVEMHVPIWSPTSQRLGGRVTCVSFDEVGRVQSVLEWGFAATKAKWYFSCWWLLNFCNVSLPPSLPSQPLLHSFLSLSFCTGASTLLSISRSSLPVKLTARAAAGP